jgi:hypothetical protein
MQNGPKTVMNTRQPNLAASFVARSRRWTPSAARTESKVSQNAQRYLALAVKCQDVLPGEAEPADWRILIKASMMPMPVVAVQPERQRATPLI